MPSKVRQKIGGKLKMRTLKSMTEHTWASRSGDQGSSVTFCESLSCN